LPGHPRLGGGARIHDSKVAEFDPTSFRDRYEEALLAHLKARQAGAVRETPPAFAAPQQVINLMDALRRSIAEDHKQRPARRGAAAATTGKPASAASARKRA